MNFKESIKHEISIFISEIFLKFLESTNASIIHRQLALQVLMSILQRTRNVLEFYVNYDCSFEHTCLVEKLVESLTKIASGLYTNPEYAMVIQPAQQVQLRQMALETLALMMRSIAFFFEEFEKEHNLDSILQIDQQNARKNLDETIIAVGEDARDLSKLDINDPYYFLYFIFFYES